MNTPVKSSRKFAEIGSLDAVARALMDHSQQIYWNIKPRSLGAKIGELDKGKLTWWINNPDKAQALSDFLEISLAELGLLQKTNNHSFVFDDFPELPHLDLKRETPFELGNFTIDPIQKNPKDSFESEFDLSEWLKSSASFRSPYEISWLHINDELQRNLFSKHLDFTARYNILFVDTLQDAGEELKEYKPLIISVRNNGGDSDLLALAMRPDGFGTLVIAPHMLSAEQEMSPYEDFSWESVTSNRAQKRLRQLSKSGQYADIKRWVWTPLPDWKHSLINWVGARLRSKEVDNTLFTDNEISDWINSFDADDVWFKESKDVMLLCNMAHNIGERKLPKPSDREAGKKLVESIFKQERKAQIYAIKKMADSRWSNTEASWDGGLTLEEWNTLSPADTIKQDQDDLVKIAHGKTLRERNEAVELLKLKLLSGNAVALVDSSVIKEISTDSFDFHSRTLANLMVRDFLMQNFINGDLSWAWSCFDNHRRPLIDAVLNSASMDTLTLVAKKLTQVSPDSMEDLGVSEALFIALGKRIVSNELINPDLVFTNLAKKVVGRLELFYEEDIHSWDLPAPLSRPIDSEPEKLAWINACWSWSLVPNILITMQPHWLFPGWAEVFPKFVPTWLTSLWPDKECQLLTKEWKEFFTITDQLVNDWDEPRFNTTRHFNLSMLNKTALGYWKAEEAWWQTVIGYKWAEIEMLQRFNYAGNDAALRLWVSYLSYEIDINKEYIPFLLCIRSPIRIWMFKQMNITKALIAINEDDWQYLTSVSATLPPVYKEPLFKRLVECSKSLLLNWGGIISSFGPAIAPNLFEQLDNDKLSSLPAAYLWKWDPEALKTTLIQENLSNNAKRKIIQTCPTAHIATVARFLIDYPTILEASERIAWARQHLASSGSASKYLLGLMKSY
jgi:hypothetical protein